MGSIRFTPSDSTWVPDFSGNVDIYAIGGGQAGFDGDGMGSAGGAGGKGGHCAVLSLFVSLGTTYYLTVGTGGTASGQAGSDTSFGTTSMVGLRECYAAGGAAGTTDVGDTTHAGGNGGTGDASNGGGGGGSATEISNGGNGGNPTAGLAGSAGSSGVGAGAGGAGGSGSGNGSNGNTYGGGGGGGGILATHGNGANGTLLINWTDSVATPVLTNFFFSFVPIVAGIVRPFPEFMCHKSKELILPRRKLITPKRKVIEI